MADEERRVFLRGISSETSWTLGPGDEPFLTQTLQVHSSS